MKTIGKCVAIAVAVLLTLGLASCSNSNEDSMKQQQLEFKSRLESSIGDIDREIDKIKNDMLLASETARGKMDAQVDRLNEVRDDLSTKLDEMGDTTADRWDEFHRSVDRSLDNAKQALREVKDQLAGQL